MLPYNRAGGNRETETRANLIGLPAAYLLPFGATIFRNVTPPLRSERSHGAALFANHRASNGPITRVDRV